MSKNALPLDVASVIKCLCEVLDLVTKALKNEIHFEKNMFIISYNWNYQLDLVY